LPMDAVTAAKKLRVTPKYLKAVERNPGQAAIPLRQAMAQLYGFPMAWFWTTADAEMPLFSAPPRTEATEVAFRPQTAPSCRNRGGANR